MTEMPLEDCLLIRDTDGWVRLDTNEVFAAAPPPPLPDTFRLGIDEPTAINAGVRDPDRLRRHDGNITTSSNGQVIQDLDIYGRVSVQHADVVVDNCIVRGPATPPTASLALINATSGNCVRLLVERVLLAPQAPSQWTNGIDGHDFTARRVHVRDTVDYFSVFNTAAPDPHQINTSIEGCYGERMAYFTPCSYQPGDNQTHNDGVQLQSGLGMRIVGNALHAVYGPAGSHQPSVSGATPAPWPNPSLACVLLSANAGPIGPLTVTDNWFYGGYLPMNVGSASVSGINLGVWHRNRWGGYGLAGSPLSKRADQTADFGFGTANANTLMDGTPITTARSA